MNQQPLLQFTQAKSKVLIVAGTVTGSQSDVRPTFFGQVASNTVLVVFDIGSTHTARIRRCSLCLNNDTAGEVVQQPLAWHEHRSMLHKRERESCCGNSKLTWKLKLLQRNSVKFSHVSLSRKAIDGVREETCMNSHLKHSHNSHLTTLHASHDMTLC